MAKNFVGKNMMTTCFRLEARQVQFLDSIARQTGAVRSEIMRQILDNVHMIDKPVVGAKISIEAIRQEVREQALR